MIKIALDPIMGINLEARFRAVTYDYESQKVILYCKVLPVDENGDEINLPLIQPYFVEQVADNNAVVLKADGTPVNTSAAGYHFNFETMANEFDYFVSIASNPIVINDLILAKMNQGKSQGKFNR